MKISTCVKQAAKQLKKKEIWFRPVHARGSGWAVTLDESGYLCLVPSSRGRKQMELIHYAQLVVDWEIVNPDKVMAEIYE